MNTWLITLAQWLAQDSSCMLVTILQVQGSAPREIGASMVIRLIPDSLENQGTKLEQRDTIGGGHLEWQAAQIARRLLQQSDCHVYIEQFSLGARLGQCCGGKVSVLFERMVPQQSAQWQQYVTALRDQPDIMLKRTLTSGQSSSDWQILAQDPALNLQHHHASFIGEQAKTTATFGKIQHHWSFEQFMVGYAFNVLLFGAGHVGHALVNVLLPLGAKIDWIDTRDDMFPALNQPNLNCIGTDTPDYEIQHAPAHSYFMIMTHDHSLDLALCEAVLKRQDYAYFGLIGSSTKRQWFERRLQARGIAEPQLARMVCPMGLPNLPSKQPEVIAVSIAAQVLQVHLSRKSV